MRTAIALGLLLAATAVSAQEDIGIVNQVNGEATYAAQGGSPAKVSPFMRVREGDRFELGAGGELRIVYLQSGRQERWQGPVSFTSGAQEARVQKGRSPEVTQLPATVPTRLARVPQLVQNARLGGVGLRGGLRPERTAADDVILAEARLTYDKLRRDLPRDDLTPELYLCATLDEYRLYDEMRPIVDEMLRKQPQSEEARALAGYVKARSGR